MFERVPCLFKVNVTSKYLRIKTCSITLQCGVTNKMSTEEDGIEKVIGRFGRYQTWILVLITIGRLPAEFQLVNVVFVLPNTEFTCLDEEAQNATNFCPCRNPEYDQSTVATSVTTEFNLICDRRPLASLAQSMLQVGILVGSLIYGYISDRYGRKLAVLLSLILEAIFTLVSAFSSQLWIFLVFRFLIGAALGGTMLCCYVFLVELSGKSFRPYIIALQEVAYVFGYFTLPIIAYFVRDWNNLQLVTSAPWLVVVVYYWLIPESPRWLITMDKKKEAVDLLTYIAKKNNLPTDNIGAVVDQIKEESMMKNEQHHASFLDLFKTPKLRIYTVITSFVWLACSNTFFGVNQYIGRLQGNLYLNVMLSAVSLVPGLALVVIATLHLRRKVSVVTSFSIAAVSLLVMIFIPSNLNSLILAFAIIGQIGAYTSFVQVYLFTSEVFPTVIRNSAMGFASMFGRIGGFVAPFVVDVGIEWVSILIFSAMALGAAVLCCLLPETKNTNLLNTIEQTEKSRGNTETKL